MMDYKNKKISMEDVNRSPKAAIKCMISKPFNPVIAYAAFADKNNLNDIGMLGDLINPKHEGLVNPEHIEILDDIERRIKIHIKNNANNIDFSTYDNAFDSLMSVSNTFVKEERNKILKGLIYKKNTKHLVAWGWWGTNIIINRELSLTAYANSHYQVAILFHSISKELHLQSFFTNIHSIKMRNNELSASGKKSAHTRWGNVVERQRRKYLELDEQYQKNTGEMLTNEGMATLIFNHGDNEFNVGFETIRDHLSAARKGVFTNKKKARR